MHNAFLFVASLAFAGAPWQQDANGAASRPAPAVGSELAEKIWSSVDNDADRITAIFKDIHQNPELAFAETRTATIVANELNAIGFDVKTGIGKTGVAAILRNGVGPTVMLRADMDANAVEEKTGVPYASTARAKRADGIEVPVAHMCGHDAHIAWMLGAAKALVGVKDQWNGTLIMIAQPAEEVILGAKAMVDDGLYTKHKIPVPDFLIGLHTSPIALGSVISAGGVRKAGSDQLDVTFRGVGTHGSTPHMGKDPVVMAANAIMQYQTIVSRRIDPMETAVVTVGAVQAGTDNNVIPESALLKLNLRFFKPEIREKMLVAIRDINAGIAKANDLPDDRMPTITMKGNCTPLINDPALVDRINAALRHYVRDERLITERPPITGSEDFHMLKGEHVKIPSAYIEVGIADPAACEAAAAKGNKYAFTNHGQFYKVELAAIPVGAKVGALAALELLVKPPTK